MKSTGKGRRMKGRPQVVVPSVSRREEKGLGIIGWRDYEETTLSLVPPSR